MSPSSPRAGGAGAMAEDDDARAPEAGAGAGRSDDGRMSALLEEVAARRPAQAPIARVFTEVLYHRAGELPETAAARATAALDFMAQRLLGRLGLRVFNPTEPEHGYRGHGTVVEVAVEDRPFLLTTLIETLRRRALEPVLVLHPIFGLRLDDQDRLIELTPARDASLRVSFIHLELAQLLDEDQRRVLHDDLQVALSAVIVATDDYEAMRTEVDNAAFALRAAAGAAYPTAEVDETLALLAWLTEGHLVFAGTRWSWAADTPQGASAGGSVRAYGICRDRGWDAVSPRLGPEELVSVALSTRPSPLHRHTRMLLIAVRIVADDGTGVGELHLWGQLTQRALAAPSSQVPLLRRKLRRILELEDLVDNSFEERRVRALFESFTKPALLTADVQRLRDLLFGILAARDRNHVGVLGVLEPTSESLSLLVTLPRERLSPHVQARIEDVLNQRLAAEISESHVTVEDSGEALLQFSLTMATRDAGAAEVDMAALQREIAEAVRSFPEQLAAELRTDYPPNQAKALAERFATRLDATYTAGTRAAAAAADLAQVLALNQAEPVRVRVRQRPTDAPGISRLRLYRLGERVELSSFVPVLESLGLTVLDQRTAHLTPVAESTVLAAPPDGAPASDGSASQRASEAAWTSDVFIHEVRVRLAPTLPRQTAITGAEDGAALTAAILGMLRGRSEIDSLNRLVLCAGIDWEDVAVLRAYRQYRRQVGTPFTPQLFDDALVSRPQVSRALIALFHARFDPGRAEDSGRERLAVLDELAQVNSYDHDRILRDLLALISATTRTNRFMPMREALALKFDSQAVPGLGRQPARIEVFVTSPYVRAIHLRGGAVARGGIRHSERREDFRTEVMGLLHAQMVKNGMIVPTGAKGGFVVPRDAADGDVVKAYRTFIGSLLDLTDNVTADGVVGPENLRRHDGDDPYLVVAADRGTAAFSDIANELAQQRGFWLDDAFASGGSHGYDHKRMGITARGAWVAIGRHLHELEIDLAHQTITVVGIGDMSGDVFGNGLLHSGNLRLLAAFDHRSIFLDPDPDPQASLAERRRLFGLARSSWADYDPALLGPGGGVFRRDQARIPLSAQVRALLRVDAPELSPPEVVRLILRAPVDLLYAGGVGTFVRASDESDAEVGDPANDDVRVEADELGARVVGEGANLALTQRARLQYARRGGRCNTDAIDNAGGVATSDREVNLKVLFALAERRGALTRPQRNTLLAELRDEVAAAVLTDVGRQAAAISREQPRSAQLLDAYAALLDDLEGACGIDRRAEALPDAQELERRRAYAAGLTRPEIALLLGHTKAYIAGRLADSAVPAQPWTDTVVPVAFPPSVVRRFGDLLPEHPLRRELVATVLANEMVDHMGTTYAQRSMQQSGCDVAAVAAAWWRARQVVAAHRQWRALERLEERMTPSLHRELEAEVESLLASLTSDYLRRARPGLPDVAGERRALAALSDPSLVPAERYAQRRKRQARWVELGVPVTLARRLATYRDLATVPEATLMAARGDRTVTRAGEVMWRLSEALPFDRLRDELRRVTDEGAMLSTWQLRQWQGLVDDLAETRQRATALVLRASGSPSASEAVADYVKRRSGRLLELRTTMARMDALGDDRLDALAVAIRALRAAVNQPPDGDQRQD